MPVCVQSVRERIEDKRKAVLGAMSPSSAMDFSSQRSGQQAFPHSSPFSDQGQVACFIRASLKRVFIE